MKTVIIPGRGHIESLGYLPTLQSGSHGPLPSFFLCQCQIVKFPLTYRQEAQAAGMCQDDGNEWALQMQQKAGRTQKEEKKRKEMP